VREIRCARLFAPVDEVQDGVLMRLQE
jgi:hypothetical protein